MRRYQGTHQEGSLECRGLCLLKFGANDSRYGHIEGCKKCRKCEVYIKTDGFICPCCHLTLARVKWK